MKFNLIFFSVEVVRAELKLGVNLSNNLSKYEVFSFQPIEALELGSMTSELKIQFRINNSYRVNVV